MNHPEVVDRLAILNAAHPRKLNEGLRHPSQLRRSWYFFYFQLPDLPEHHAQADDWEFLQDFLRDAQPPYTPEEIEALHRGVVAARGGDRDDQLLPLRGATLVRRDPAHHGAHPRHLGRARPLPRPHARRAPPRRRAQPRPRRAPARRLALGPPRRGRARQPAADRLLRPPAARRRNASVVSAREREQLRDAWSSRSRPASSTSDTPTSGLPTVRRSFCCTAGRTTSTPSPRSAPLLAAAGYRVIVPYLRGYGTTRFLSDETFRNGQQSVLAVDTVALMDALGIEKAVVAGADWGARTADVVAALWPRAVRRARLGERVSDRQASRPASCRWRRRPSGSGGTSTTSRPSAAGPGTSATGASSRGSSGGRPRRSGTSTTPRSSAAPPRSTTRITSRS